MLQSKPNYMHDHNDPITACEQLMISICRREQARNLRRQSLRLETWQPDSARKHRVREFITLSLDEEPYYIGKIPLSPEDEKVAREYEILCRLRGRGRHIVEPLQPVSRGFVMRYCAGVDFPHALGPDDGPERWLPLVEQVMDKMAAFHSECLSAPGEVAPEAAARDYVDDWQPAQEVTRRALAAAQVGAAHGDLGPWNVRYDRRTDKVSFIDWEDFRPLGLPALDALNFIFTLPLLLHPDYREIGFGRLHELCFERQGTFGLIAARGLARYAAAMRVSAVDLVALLPVYYEAMVVRFRREDRPVEHLFYIPFQQRFALEQIVWLDQLRA